MPQFSLSEVGIDDSLIEAGPLTTEVRFSDVLWSPDTVRNFPVGRRGLVYRKGEPRTRSRSPFWGLRRLLDLAQRDSTALVVSIF